MHPFGCGSSRRLLYVPLAVALALPVLGWAGTGIWQSSGPIGGQTFSVALLAVDTASPSTLYGVGPVKSTDSGRTWFTSSLGLPGEAIAIAIDPKTPTTLYAAGPYFVDGDLTIFKSLDAGGTWVKSKLPSTGGPLASSCTIPGPDTATPVAFAIDPTSPSTLYLGSCPGGLFKSTDAGATWADATHGFFGGVNIVTIDPITPTTLYVSNGYAIHRSRDGGGTWVRISDAKYAKAIVVDPTNSATVYATSYPGVVIKSTNGGATWTTMNNSFPNHDISSLVIDPSNPATLYLGTHDAGIFRSTVSGEAWEPVGQGIADLRIVVRLVIAPTAPHTLYASANGTFRSTDAGASWAPLSGPARVNVLSFASSTTLGDTVFAGTGDDGVYRSTDRGGTWAAVNTGLKPGPYEVGISVEALVVDPATPSTLYAGTHAGVFKSTDSGATWVGANRGLDSGVFAAALAIDPKNPATLYLGNIDGVAKSTDGGDNWSFVYRPPQIPPFYGVHALVVDPITPSTLYAIMGYGQVLKSTDSGSTWAAADAGLPIAGATALVIDPITSATLYAATGESGVFKSTDSGGTWAPFNAGLTDLSIVDLVVNSTSPDNLYAASWRSGVFRSTDAGATWAAFNKGLTSGWVSALAHDPTGTGTLYAGLRNDSVWQFRGSTGAFHTVTPCRVVDTRVADGPALAAGASRAYKLVGKCGIPPDAGSVSMNVTITEATSPGHLRIHPGNMALLPNSSLNFASGQTRANNPVSLLGAAGDIVIFSGQGSGSVQVIVDVNGYFQ